MDLPGLLFRELAAAPTKIVQLFIRRIFIQKNNRINKRFIGHIAHKLDIVVTRGQLIAMEIVKGFFF